MGTVSEGYNVMVALTCPANMRAVVDVDRVGDALNALGLRF